MKISVCIATYNGELYLKEQLHSILSQLGTDDEIVVSDDGSTDSTLDIVNGVNDSRIRLVFNCAYKRGPVGNFENALYHCTGDVIFLSDQDDVWFPDKVTECIKYLSLPDVLMIVSDCMIVNGEGDLLNESFFKHYGIRQSLISNLAKNSFMGCCMAFHRAVLDKALPFPSNVPMHDWWLGLNATMMGRVEFFNKPLIKYRRHGLNVSTSTEISNHSIQKKISDRFFLCLNLFIRYLR